MDELFFSKNIGLVETFSLLVRSGVSGWEGVANILFDALSDTLPATKSAILADVAKGTSLKVTRGNV